VQQSVAYFKTGFFILTGVNCFHVIAPGGACAAALQPESMGAAKLCPVTVKVSSRQTFGHGAGRGNA